MLSITSKTTLILSGLASIAPYFIRMFFDITPCFLCVIQRILFFNIFISSIVAIKFTFFKYVVKTLSLFIMSIATYHFMIVVEIIKQPKFCKINPTFFEQINSSCNDSPIVLIAFAFFIAAMLRLQEIRKQD